VLFLSEAVSPKWLVLIGHYIVMQYTEQIIHNALLAKRGSCASWSVKYCSHKQLMNELHIDDYCFIY